MKKMFKLGIGVLILGIILVLIGMSSSEDKSVFFKNARPVLYSRYEAEKYQTLKQKISNPQEIQNLSLDINNANLVIKPGKEYSLKYQGWSDAPVVSVNNGILQVKTSSNEQQFVNRIVGLFFGFGKTVKNDTLVLTIPQDVKFKTVRLVAGANYEAKVNLKELKVQQFDVVGSMDVLNLDSCNLDAANVDISGSNAKLNNTILLSGKLTFDDVNLNVLASTLKDVALVNDSGDIEYSNVSLDKGSLNTSDSYFKMSNSNIANGYTVVNQSGETNILNTFADGYWLNAASEDGELNLFGKIGTKEITQNNTAANCLKIQTQDGSITVK